MARDLNSPDSGPESDERPKESIKAVLVIDYVILIVKSKLRKEHLKYLTVSIHKVPKTTTINEESSERVYPSETLDNDIKFQFSKEVSSFRLNFQQNILPELPQYEVQIQIMHNGERKTIGLFGVGLEDIKQSYVDQKMKLRSLQSEIKEVQDIDIKYKVSKVQTCSSESNQSNQCLPNVPQTDSSTHLESYQQVASGESHLNDVVDFSPQQEPVPNFHPNSCIVVLGTTGRGKTTTVNLYTGNSAETGSASHSTTRASGIYHQQMSGAGAEAEGRVHWPVWLDTVGLDESDATVTNSDLVRSYLRLLQATRIQWLHAIIWCITPEDKKLQHLKDQAQVIKLFGRKSQSIWKNVIIIAKEGKSKNHDINFQGALAAIADIEGGHQDIVRSVQCLEYELDFDNKRTVTEARRRLNTALCNIKHPVRVVFSNQVCQDCGQVGDERLLTDFCHEKKTEVDRKYFSSYLPKRSACSHCKNSWSRQVLGRWSFTSGPPCVRISNKRDVREGETVARNKAAHNMMPYKPLFFSLNCIHNSENFEEE